MFTKEDILARLQNGDSMDEIAKEMSDALNAAQADYESAIQADVEANRIKEAKRQAVDMILDGVCDFLVAAGKDKLIEDIKDIDTDDVIDMLDSAIELGETLDKLKSLEFAGLKLPTVEHKCGSGDCGCNKPDPAKVAFKLGQVAGLTNADDIIKDFLKNI
jgi:hypothetical protein